MGTITRLISAVWPTGAAAQRKCQSDLESARATITSLETQNELLRLELGDAKEEVRQKQVAIGALIRWIRSAHRLDAPIAPGTARKALHDAQA